MNRKILKVLIFLVDLLLIQLSLLLTLFFRYGFDGLWVQWGRHFNLFAILSAIWLLDFYIANLYNLVQPFSYKRFAFCMAVNIALAVSLFYIFPKSGISPKTNLVVFVAIFIILILVWRNIFEKLLDRLGIKRSVLFIGVDAYSLKLARTIMDNPRLGYKLTGFLIGREKKIQKNGQDSNPSIEIPDWLKNNSKIRCMNTMEELTAYLEENNAHSLVVSEHWYRDIYLDLYRLFPRGIRVYQFSSFWELIEETIPVNATDEIWFLQNMSRGPYSVYHAIKRFFDIFFTVLFLPLIFTVCALTAIFVRLTSRGPVLFKQTRVGLGNQSFTIYKFRSMKLDAEKNGAVWAQEKDPRLTPIGDFIRRFRFDELPQIINILKGDMSLVGPRPERPEFVEHLAKAIPHYNLRHLVRPGLSGWAQVKYRYGASVEDSEIKLMHDLYYVKNVSPLLDLKIVLKTVLTILTKSGR